MACYTTLRIDNVINKKVWGRGLGGRMVQGGALVIRFPRRFTPDFITQFCIFFEQEKSLLIAPIDSIISVASNIVNE